MPPRLPAVRGAAVNVQALQVVNWHNSALHMPCQSWSALWIESCISWRLPHAGAMEVAHVSAAKCLRSERGFGLSHGTEVPSDTL